MQKKNLGISHLVFETPEIVLENYLEEAGKMIHGIIKHLDSHQWHKAVYCQIRKNEGEDWIRVGFIFLQTPERDEDNKLQPMNGYRMFEVATLREELAYIFLTHMCQAVALAGCNSTNVQWNCAPLTNEFYAIAPVQVLERFLPNFNRDRDDNV